MLALVSPSARSAGRHLFRATLIVVALLLSGCPAEGSSSGVEFSPADEPAEPEEAEEPEVIVDRHLPPLMSSDPPSRTQVLDVVAVDEIGEVGNGSLIAEWTSKVEVGSVGTVEVVLRALETLPTSDELRAVSTAQADGRRQLAVPIYVRPGEVTVRVEAVTGIRMLDDDGTPSTQLDQVFTVVQGSPSSRSWSFEATRPGETRLRIVAEQARQADPDVPLPVPEIQQLPLDQAQVSLPLTVVATAPIQSTREAQPDTGETAWAAVAALWTFLGVSTLFGLWLTSQALDHRGKAPRLAAVLGYLPHKLAEFKNLKGKTGASSS